MKQTMPAFWLLFLIACAIGLLSQAKPPVDASGNMKVDSVTWYPKLTDAQKLKIRSAQVEFFQAKTALESTPQWGEFQVAQNKVNKTVAEVLKDSGVDQNKYRLEQSLEFSEIQKPEPAEKK